MPFALQFDGVNDHLTFATPVGNGMSSAGDDSQHWALEFDVSLENPSNTYVYRPIESTSISRVELLFRKSDGLVRFVSPSSGQYQWTGIDLTAAEVSIKLEKLAGSRTLAISVNGGAPSNDTGGDNACDFDVFGVNSNNGWLDGYLKNLKFTDFITPANNRNFSPDDSARGPGSTILTDTISGNNAVGVGFPTDGSQWIDLGGGGVELNVTELLNSFQDSSLLNVSYNVSAIITEQLGSFSDSSQVNLTSAQNVTGAVTEVFGSFVDLSLINVNQTVGVDISVTELLNSFSDGSNVTISKDITSDVTEVLTSFSDDSSVKLPVTWSVKQPVETTWGVKGKSSTIWIKKG